MKRLERGLGDLDVADARAFSGYARGLTSEQTYMCTTAELKAERSWLEEELNTHSQVVGDAQRLAANARNIQRLYPLVIDRRAKARFEDKRFVLECLDAQVKVGPTGVTLSLAIPDDGSGFWDPVSTPPRVGGMYRQLCN